MWKNGKQSVVIGRMPFFVLCCVGGRRRWQRTYSDLQIPPRALYLLYNEQEG